MIELRDKLRVLGYDARIANGDCFDVHQNGRIHYLSADEAEALLAAGAGIDLWECSNKGGRWYTFPTNQPK